MRTVVGQAEGVSAESSGQGVLQGGDGIPARPQRAVREGRIGGWGRHAGSSQHFEGAMKGVVDVPCVYPHWVFLSLGHRRGLHPLTLPPHPAPTLTLAVM